MKNGIAHGLLAQRDWPTYGYDAGSTRFLPLTQINTGNVSRLMKAWTSTTVRTQQFRGGAFRAVGGRRSAGRVRFRHGERWWRLTSTRGTKPGECRSGVIEELEAKGIRNTGTLNMGGSITTAGNLVFVGATTTVASGLRCEEWQNIVGDSVGRPGCTHTNDLPGQGRQAIRHCSCRGRRLLRPEDRR